MILNICNISILLKYSLNIYIFKMGDVEMLLGDFGWSGYVVDSCGLLLRNNIDQNQPTTIP